jgi:transposase
MIIFLDLPDVEVEGVEVAEEIVLTLRTMSPTALCPSCGTASSRIQSRYTRVLRDLPSIGHPLRLIMHVRRFFCRKSTCAQKIFVERLPDLCHPHAQPYQAAARSAPPAWIHHRGSSRGRPWKRIGHQRESRYDLAPASPSGAVCPTRATRHWSGRLGCDTKS